MKKLFFTVVVIVGSMVAFMSCSDENMNLDELNLSESTRFSGGDSGSEPILE
jgi:hypothetical protein